MDYINLGIELPGRTPHGVRGLKSAGSVKERILWASRTPHGVRGLKYRVEQISRGVRHVAPLTGCVD